MKFVRPPRNQAASEKGSRKWATQDVVEKFAAVAAEVHVRCDLMYTRFAHASRSAAAGGLAHLADVEDVLISVD